MSGSSASWCKETDGKINYTKLCRLLVDGGTQAVRSVFDGIHPPSSLKAILNANKATLQKLKKPKGKVLNNEQWDQLYPPSGSDPNSEDFDITLLFVLLRNICGLTPPVYEITASRKRKCSWDKLPHTTENSKEANLVRIKHYRNNTIAHKPNTEINDADFEQHWQDISSALLSLGLNQDDIDDLKSSPLGGKDYNQLLNDWYMSDKDIKTQLEEVKSNTADIRSGTAAIKSDTAVIKLDTADLKSDTAAIKSDTAAIKSDTAVIKLDTADLKSDTAAIKSDTAVIKLDTADIKSDTVLLPGIQEDISQLKSTVCSNSHLKDSLINRLANSDFSSLTESLCKSFHPNTRQWILDEVKSHIYGGKSQPCGMLITACPGMGKSTIAAKLCQTYKDLGCLAGCHFFQFSNSTRNDPRLMLQSIARQMCDTVPGYREALESKLQTNLGKNIDDMGCEELFTVLLEEPCHNLKVEESFVVVLDAIDECCSKLKHELQEILKNKLSLLPSWLRLVITTRPPPSFNALKANKSIFIDPTDPKNQRDIEIFFKANLNYNDNQSRVTKELVKVSGGLFLVAFFLIDEMQKKRISSPSELKVIFPHGLSSVYEKYLERLRTVLLPYITEEGGFFRMLEAVVASKDPIPIKMMHSILGLKSAIPGERKARNDALSQLHSLFPVENDHVSVFHKSMVDFLILEESEQDFNTSVGKMSERSVEKLPDEVPESLQGASEISDSSSHVEGKSLGSRNEKRDQNKPLNTVCPDEPPKDHEFSVRVDDGNKVLVDQCYEVLSEILNGEKDLTKPLDLIDSEKYALDFVWELSLKSSSNYSKFVNYFLISALLCYQQYENHAIQRQIIHNELDDPFHRVFFNCARFFHVHPHGHKEWCPFAQPLNFGRYVEFVLQTARSKQVDQEITPNALQLFQKYKLSYSQIKVIIDIQECQDKVSSVSNLGCGDGFVVIQHTAKLNTVVTKYRQDGTFVFQKSFPGKKNVYVSPNHQFLIVVTGVLVKAEIEIRNARTFEPVKSFQSPNIIRSCHMFGDQPWYIVTRCYNNKIYVMEGETGTIVSTIAGIGQHVEVEAVSHSGHILLGTSNRYRNDLFTDEDGNFVEEMSWSNDVIGQLGRKSIKGNYFYQRKLFLCHYEKPEEKIPIYPTKSFGWCCTSNSPKKPIYGFGESVAFSQDGSLLAFHYNGSIFIRNTRDCSLYKRVYLGPNYFVIFDHNGILLLTKDYVIVYNGSQFNENVIMIINLHSNEIENIYCCTSGLQFLPKTIGEPLTLITNRHSESNCKVYLYALHNLDL